MANSSAQPSPEDDRIFYLSKMIPGISRDLADAVFVYHFPDGHRVLDLEVLNRIRSLVIPPAWTDVWISPNSRSHLQATGRDARGRKQYRYHDVWRQLRDQNKFSRLSSFAETLPRIRRSVRRDFAIKGMPRNKILATVVMLLERTLIRVGNDEYAEQNGSYGLTTLRKRHASVRGPSVKFSFRGKSGKEHSIHLCDPALAKIVKRCQDLPGQELFEYVDDQGQHHDVGSQDVNAYIRASTGEGFTAKDFRTWHATVLAVTALEQLVPHFEEISSSAASLKKALVNVTREVSEVLGNTPAVCRKSYIHPRVFEAFRKGDFLKTLVVSGRTGRGLSRAEKLTLALLKESRPRGKSRNLADRSIRNRAPVRSHGNKKGNYA